MEQKGFFPTVIRRALLCVLLLTFLIGAARAAGPTSPLTGVTLAAGAQRLQDHALLAQVRPLLDKLAQSSGRSIGRMEVYQWTSADGVQQTMDEALRRSTDLYKKLPGAQRNGVDLSTFVAASKARKLAYVGMWVSKGQALYLAWGEIVPPKGASPPAPTQTLQTLRRTPRTAGPSSAPHGAPAFPRLARKPHVLQGTILDRSGRPMPGVTVTASFTFPSPYLQTADVFKATTDGRGRYSINLRRAVTVGHISVNQRVTYNGVSCPLPFARLDAGGHRRDSDIVDQDAGDVVNFTPALSGLRESDASPDNPYSYFGGALTVDNALNTSHHALPAGSRVRLVLTPAGPLLDGSAGRPLVRDIAVNYTSVNDRWNDIPIGRYLVSAALILPGGASQPLQATARIPVGQMQVMQSFPLNANTPLFFPLDGTGEHFNPVNLDIAFP